MWAQDWVNIYDLVAPYPEVTSVDVTLSLSRANYSVLRMFEEAESFFTSLGLEPMTSDFWNKSMLVRPTDGREVTCHGSATDMYTQTDFRYSISLALLVFCVETRRSKENKTNRKLDKQLKLSPRDTRDALHILLKY